MRYLYNPLKGYIYIYMYIEGCIEGCKVTSSSFPITRGFGRVDVQELKNGRVAMLATMGLPAASSLGCRV